MSNKILSVVSSSKFSQLVRKHETWVRSNGRKGQQLVLANAAINAEKLTSNNLKQACFSRVDFNNLSDIKQVNLTGAAFVECQFNGVYFTEVDFTDVRIYGSSFRASCFNACVFSGGELSTSDLTNTYWRNTKCRGVEFTGSNFTASIFNNTKILANKLIGANLSALTFRNLPLANTTFCRLDFGGWFDFAGWSVFITSTHTQIGCERHRNQDWLRWEPDDAEIRHMHRWASRWWRQYGPVVKAAIVSISSRSRRRKTR